MLDICPFLPLMKLLTILRSGLGFSHWQRQFLGTLPPQGSGTLHRTSRTNLAPSASPSNLQPPNNQVSIFWSCPCWIISFDGTPHAPRSLPREFTQTNPMESHFPSSLRSSRAGQSHTQRFHPVHKCWAWFARQSWAGNCHLTTLVFSCSTWRACRVRGCVKSAPAQESVNLILIALEQRPSALHLKL